MLIHPEAGGVGTVEPCWITFNVPMVPPKTTHHSKRIVRVGQFSKLADTEALTTAREILIAGFRPFRPAAPLEGPLKLHLDFEWPWRKGDSKKKRAGGRIPCTVKPDCTNAAKTAEDILVLLGFMHDDNQVTELHVTKFIGGNPGITVHLEMVEIPWKSTS
jgi:Holliday junction resolvase RusA-like endonuclease